MPARLLDGTGAGGEVEADFLACGELHGVVAALVIGPAGEEVVGLAVEDGSTVEEGELGHPPFGIGHLHAQAGFA